MFGEIIFSDVYVMTYLSDHRSVTVSVEARTRTLCVTGRAL